MSEDWFLAAVARVVRAGEAAAASLDETVRALQDGTHPRLGGRSVADVVDDLVASGGRNTRLRTAEAFREYEQAVSSMRSAVVRFLVDHERLSQTDVARRLHVSRQAVARLYLSDPDADTFAPDTR